jgi:hypothetical protein
VTEDSHPFVAHDGVPAQEDRTVSDQTISPQTPDLPLPSSPTGPGPFFFQGPAGDSQGPYTLRELQHLARTGTLRASSLVQSAERPTWGPAADVPGLFSTRSYIVALVLSIVFGGLGVDRFYLGYTGLGVLKLITFGGLGIWWIIDMILVGARKLPDAEGLPLASSS